MNDNTMAASDGHEMSRPEKKGCHCSCQVWAVALLMATPAAWSQAAKPVTPKSQPAAAAAKAPAKSPTVSKPLNLYTGHAAELLSGTQWDRLVAMQPTNIEDSDVASASEPEVVKVKGEQLAAPQVPGGIASIFWALRHPTQAWRALAPNPP